MIPEPLTRYVVPQGSITIEGISLTVASINGNEVEIAIIPSTPWPPVPHSTFQVDVLGKYAERQQQKREKFIFTEQYLIANGY